MALLGQASYLALGTARVGVLLPGDRVTDWVITVVTPAASLPRHWPPAVTAADPVEQTREHCRLVCVPDMQHALHKKHRHIGSMLIVIRISH